VIAATCRWEIIWLYLFGWNMRWVAESMFTPDPWAWSPEHGELCRVIETQTLWGETVCRVWLPGKDTVVRVPATRLRPVHEASVGTVDGMPISPPRRARFTITSSRRTPSSSCGTTRH